MTAKPTMQCPTCHGEGLVDRQTDQHLANTATKETCARCAGSGRVPLDPKTVTERPSDAAFIASMRNKFEGRQDGTSREIMRLIEIASRITL